MSKRPAKENARNSKSLTIERQLAFAYGVFQGDITVRTLLESISEGVIIINGRGTIVVANPRAEQMFGYRRGDLVGRPHSILVPDNFQNVHNAMMTNFMESPKIRPMGQGLNLTGRRQDGSVFPVEISLSFIDSINVRFFLAFVSDISHRKEMEQALKNRNQELSAFVYSVAHDLRNPLNSMLTSVELIKGTEKNIEKDGLTTLGFVEQSIHRMSQIITDLLALSSIGAREVNREQINLSVMAKMVLEELKASSASRKTEFIIQPNLIAKADSGLIKILLENIIGNAWKFTANKTRAHIEIGCKAKGDKVIYSIKDNGVGFDKPGSANLFKPFHRLHSAKKFKGTGIGLSIAKRIIEKHNGEIWADGKPGKGAIFYFSLS